MFRRYTLANTLFFIRRNLYGKLCPWTQIVRSNPLPPHSERWRSVRMGDPWSSCRLSWWFSGRLHCLHDFRYLNCPCPLLCSSLISGWVQHWNPANRNILHPWGIKAAPSPAPRAGWQCIYLLMGQTGRV